MSRSIRNCLRTKLVLFGLLALSGCFEPAARLAAPGRLPMPRKDEVMLVDGRPFSLTDYFDIRRRVGPSPSREAILWIGEGSLLLQEEWADQGKRLDPSASVILAGYAQGVFSPEQARSFFSGHFPSTRELFSEIESLRNRAAVQQNPSLLAELK